MGNHGIQTCGFTADNQAVSPNHVRRLCRDSNFVNLSFTLMIDCEMGVTMF